MRRTLPAIGFALLLTGCGADKPASQRPVPDASAQAFTNPNTSSEASTTSSGVPPQNSQSASASDSTSREIDPLIGGSGKAARDPLIGENSTGPKQPFQRSQPLSGQDPDVDDSTLLMNGQTMPTRRTHWLRGRMHDAQVRVLINGIRVGNFANWVDQDITPRLRPGVNTATFTYQPSSPQASAQIDVLEGEHQPPIPPLAAFRRASIAALSTQDALKPQTETFTFTAQ